MKKFVSLLILAIVISIFTVCAAENALTSRRVLVAKDREMEAWVEHLSIHGNLHKFTLLMIVTNTDTKTALNCNSEFINGTEGPTCMIVNADDGSLVTSGKIPSKPHPLAYVYEYARKEIMANGGSM